jgi:murein DD-endopeptidase MepM/ murein hydrolase activator NlpD
MAKQPKSKTVAEPEAEKVEANQPGLINGAQAARLIMVTIERIRQLVKAGYIQKIGRDSYPLVSVVQGYIRFLKEEERRTSKVQADSRVRDARAKEIEQRMALRSGNLIDIEDAKAEFATFVTTSRAEWQGLPASFTRDLELRRQLETKVDEILTRIAARYEKAIALLASGGDPLEAFAEASTGPMGEAQPHIS